MSEAFRYQHADTPAEPDRGVLVVDLSARRGGETVWHEAWVLDAHGHERGSAMARPVSQTVRLAVLAAGRGELAPGVQATPSDPKTVAAWLDEIGLQAQHLSREALSDGREPGPCRRDLRTGCPSRRCRA